MNGLKYISWGDTTGYAVAAKAYIRALAELGVSLTWAPMMAGSNLYELQHATHWPCPKLSAVCNKQINYDRVLIHTVPEYFPEWIKRERQPGRLVFGYTVWELDTLPSHWPGILNQLDGVIVPCKWNVDVFKRSGVSVPIHVVPHLSQFEADANITSEDRASLLHRTGYQKATDNRFVFYNIGFWSHRKAPYLSIEAYFQAFSKNDRVLMMVKTCAKDITRWHRQWRNGFRKRHPSPLAGVDILAKRYPNHPPLIVIPDESLSDGEMLALHELGDCFVSLTRAEGWGLGAFEAARLGKPVVMTGYGGQLDFLAEEDAYLVDYTLVPVHEPTWADSYKPEHHWAEPSVPTAAKMMRDVFENQQQAHARGTRLAARIAKEFNPTSITDSFLRALR